MNDIIKPTIGRKVWFKPGNVTQFIDANGGLVTPKIISDQPMDATIVYVWHDRMVNLLVNDHHGLPFALTSVTLVQECDAYVANSPHCVWMPYQLGQAKKSESIDSLVNQIYASDNALTTNLQFQRQAAADAQMLTGVVPAIKPGESPVGFSLDDDKPLTGGVCDMSAGCEACQ